MSRATETTLVQRSLTGDFQARAELYSHFVYNTSDVRRHGAHYSDRDDFLQDVFVNALHSAQCSMPHGALSEFFERVAIWTALERERLRHINLSTAANSIRLCAAIETDGPGNVLNSYVPPRAGNDLLHARLAAVCGVSQYTMLRSRALQNTSWEAVAQTAGKPLISIGPMMARAIGRLTRLFGAPPPLNDDFEPTFTYVSGRAARGRSDDPSKPRGRVVAMQLDTEYYRVTPQLRAFGLSVPSDVRTIVLWDAARSSAPPDDALRSHLAACNYCSDVFRSLILLHQAMCSPEDVEFRLCPGASTLLADENQSGACNRHLEECETCRKERDEAFGAAQAAEESTLKASAGSPAWKTIAGWTVAAALLVGGTLAAVLHHSGPDKAVAASAPADMPEPLPKSKYAGLIEKVNVDPQAVLASVEPSNQLLMMDALNAMQHGNLIRTKILAEQTANVSNDPGARMLLSVCLYSEQRFTDAYREMQASEATAPRQPYRCWTLLQCALNAGDPATADREGAHLAKDPVYGPRAKTILDRMHAMK